MRSARTASVSIYIYALQVGYGNGQERLIPAKTLRYFQHPNVVFTEPWRVITLTSAARIVYNRGSRAVLHLLVRPLTQIFLFSDFVWYIPWESCPSLTGTVNMTSYGCHKHIRYCFYLLSVCLSASSPAPVPLLSRSNPNHGPSRLPYTPASALPPPPVLAAH